MVGLHSCQRTVYACFCILAVLLVHPIAVQAQPPAAPQTAASTARAVDYVLLIDNSASIRRPEDQLVIREAAKLFIDVVEDNDRFSIILFGRDAQIGLSQTFTAESTRDEAKAKVDAAIDFSHQFSDLRAGIRLLQQERDTLFRGGAVKPVVIVLSDGKLETEDKDAAKAYEELRSLVSGTLAGLPFFTVGLGQTAINDYFLDAPKINGLILLRDVLAGPAGRFYHAESLDAIFEIYIQILKDTKNVSDLAEEEGVFKLDESVTSVTLVVRKRTSAGELLCQSPDLTLQCPGGKEFAAFSAAVAGTDHGMRVVWKSDCQHFDLVMLRNPVPGVYQLAQKSGDSLDILSCFTAHIHLQHDIRPVYYTGVPFVFQAWLSDDRTGDKSDAAYQVFLKLAPEEGFDESEDLDEMREAVGAVFALAHPDDFKAALEPGDYGLQLTARSNEDESFFRRTPRIPVLLHAPFFTFKAPERGKYWVGPDQPQNLPLGVTLDAKAKSYPANALPPQVSCKVSRITPGAPPRTQDVELEAGAGNTYAADFLLSEPGTYTLAYTLEFAFPNRANLILTSEEYTTEATGWDTDQLPAVFQCPDKTKYWKLPFVDAPVVDLEVETAVDPNVYPPDAMPPEVSCEIHGPGAPAVPEPNIVVLKRAAAGRYTGQYVLDKAGRYELVATVCLPFQERPALTWRSDVCVIKVRSWIWILIAILILALLVSLYYWRRCRLKRIHASAFMEILDANKRTIRAEEIIMEGKGKILISGIAAVTRIRDDVDPIDELIESENEVYLLARPVLCLKPRFYIGVNKGEAALDEEEPLVGDVLVEANKTVVVFESQGRLVRIQFERI